MPDIFFATKDEIPESLREHAKEKDGKFAVGVVPEGFRDRNIALSKERDELKTKYEPLTKIVGDDVDKFTADLNKLRDIAKQVEDGKLKGTDAIEREINARLEGKAGDFQKQIKDARDAEAASKVRAAEFENKYKGMVVDQAIISAVMGEGSGANPSALPDILNRARAVFHSKDDGTLIAKKGDTIWYGGDGESSITPKEWVAALLKEAPYLGKSSAGTGGTGASGGKGGMTDEAFAKLTPAQRIAAHRRTGG